MFLFNVWQNMKIFVQYVIWLIASTLLQFYETASCGSGSYKSENGQALTLEILPTEHLWNDTFVEVSHAFNDVVLVKDACHQGRMAYAAASGDFKFRIIATSDGFKKSSVVLRVNAGVFEVEPVLTSLTFVSDGLLTVINKELVLFDVYTFHTIKSKGIDRSQRIDTVSSHMCCTSKEKWCQNWSDMVLIYKHYTSTRVFQYSTDGGHHFKLQNMTSTNQQFKILSSTLMGLDSTAVFLLEDVATTKLMLLSMRLGRHTHFYTRHNALSYLLAMDELDYSPGQLVDMRQIQSNYYSLLFWDRERIVYKSMLDMEGFDVAVHQLADRPIFLTDEYIRHVDSNYLGEFLMVTSHNRLLYGREGFKTEATYVTSLAHLITDDLAAVLSTAGDLLLVSSHSLYNIGENSKVYTHRIYLSGQINLQKDLLGLCPYQDVVIEGFHRHYYLDLHDSIQLYTHVHTSAWSDISLVAEVVPDQPVLLTNKLLRTPSDEHGVLHISMETVGTPNIGAYQGRNITDNDTETLRTGALRVMTTAASLTCTEPSQYIAHVSLGCRRDKRMIVRRPELKCDILRHQYSYEIAADMYDPDHGSFGRKYADVPKTVQYDFVLFGCTNRTYFNTPFVFDLHLYQGSTYMGPMRGDYVVYEVNGMNRFQYNLLIKDTGCLYAPQTWREMRFSALNGTPLKDVWTRANYRHCNISYKYLSSRPDTADSDDEYEILSYGNGNYMTFTRNGIYQFEIIVVDHDYSFCDLRTRLAVEVYGVQPQVPIPLFWVMFITLGSSLLVIAIVFYFVEFSRWKRLSEEREMKDIEVFEEMITSHMTAQEQRAAGLLDATTSFLSDFAKVSMVYKQTSQVAALKKFSNVEAAKTATSRTSDLAQLQVRHSAVSRKNSYG